MFARTFFFFSGAIAILFAPLRPLHAANAFSEAKLTAGDGAAGDGLDHAISMHGNTMVVGADRGDGNEPDSGSAYVFKKRGDWVEVAELTASDGAADDGFGHAVSMSGNIITRGTIDGPVRCRERLGALLRYYHREVA